MRLMNIVVRTAIGIATLITRYQGMWQGSPRQLIARVFSGRPLFAPSASPIAALPATVEIAEVA
jgi:hypothetical protein